MRLEEEEEEEEEEEDALVGGTLLWWSHTEAVHFGPRLAACTFYTCFLVPFYGVKGVGGGCFLFSRRGMLVGACHLSVR